MTEAYLSTLPISPQTLSDLYRQFLATNKITDHTPLPVLQSKLPSTTTTPQNQPTTTNSNTTLGKRQREEEHPSSTKHFYCETPPPTITILTIHNSSIYNLNQQELDLLNKGLICTNTTDITSRTTNPVTTTVTIVCCCVY